MFACWEALHASLSAHVFSVFFESVSMLASLWICLWLPDNYLQWESAGQYWTVGTNDAVFVMIMWEKPLLHVANKSSRVEIRHSGRGVITTWPCRLPPNRTAPTISEVGSRKLNLAGNFCNTFQSCSGPDTSLLNSTSAWAATPELTAGEASITRVSFKFCVFVFEYIFFLSSYF